LKVLFDEDVPRKLARAFAQYDLAQVRRDRIKLKRLRLA
jgi:hypothetical protein